MNKKDISVGAKIASIVRGQRATIVAKVGDQWQVKYMGGFTRNWSQTHLKKYYRLVK